MMLVSTVLALRGCAKKTGIDADMIVRIFIEAKKSLKIIFDWFFEEFKFSQPLTRKFGQNKTVNHFI